MKRIKTRIYLLLLMVFAAATSFAADGIKVIATAPVVPLLKGIDNNQLVRLLVYIPAGQPSINFTEITGTLNEAGVAAFETIDIYATGREASFSTKKRIGSVQPSRSMRIPLNVTLQPGMNYLWFSTKIRATTSIDARPSFHVSQLKDGSKTYRLEEEGSGFVKRLGVAVKRAGEQGIHTFRIPGMATTNKGTLITVYDIRYKHSGDLPANIDVGMSRSTDGGQTWEPMKIIMDMGAPHENNGIGDPAVLFDPVTKKIWVAALWSKGNRSIAGSKPGLSEDITGQFVLVSSDDDGRTWSAPKSITAMIKDPAWNLFFNGPGSGIAMADGKLVFAAQYWDENAMPHSNIVYSTDHGKSWKTEDGPKPNTTEAQVIETTKGTLMLNMRDNRGGFRSVATTTDLGKTWTEHHTSYRTLQEPVCMASFIKENVNVKGKQKEVVFFGNPNTRSGRYNMTIKASLDLAEIWDTKNELLIDERNSYGYSSLTKVNDFTLGFFYEGVGDLYFVRVPISDIIK